MVIVVVVFQIIIIKLIPPFKGVAIVKAGVR
jgi:hypothetical protein